ncbi:IS3 family transposase [Rhodobacteraceae bacterium]|nr:IS3 family transposase [Paracoccaceae bacterium]
MYGYEDRLRAVGVYIQLGKRVRATIRELGSPTKTALKGWHREYEHWQGFQIHSVSRLPEFLKVQKQVALEHYAGQGRCISWRLRALGYSGRVTLRAWVERIDAAKRVRSMSRKARLQDNAACEGVFGCLKTEVFSPREWRAFTAAQFIDEVDACIRWYNEPRIKISLGGKTPIEYRKSPGLMP